MGLVSGCPRVYRGNSGGFLGAAARLQSECGRATPAPSASLMRKPLVCIGTVGIGTLLHLEQFRPCGMHSFMQGHGVKDWKMDTMLIGSSTVALRIPFFFSRYGSDGSSTQKTRLGCETVTHWFVSSSDSASMCISINWSWQTVWGIEFGAATWLQNWLGHWISMEIHSGELTFCYGKIHPFFMGKSTISMAIFNSKLLVHQRLSQIKMERQQAFDPQWK